MCVHDSVTVGPSDMVVPGIAPVDFAVEFYQWWLLLPR